MMEKIIEMIIDELKSRGYEAEVTKNVKNTVVMTGITIGTGDIRPTIYINDYIKENVPFDRIISGIISEYESSPELDLDVKRVNSWEYAKDNVFLCLQQKSNESLLKKDFLDLEMYIRVKIPNANGYNSSYKIKKGMFKEISEEEIFANAFLKTKENIFVEDMINLLAPMMLQHDEMTVPPMLVLTSKDKINGASAICDKALLSTIAKKFNKSLVILPSSIHECIVHLDDNPDMDHYNTMVREVNQTELAPEEILSDHAYFFNKDTCEITW